MTCKFLNFTLAGSVIATSEIQAGEAASFLKQVSSAGGIRWAAPQITAGGGGWTHSDLR